MQKTTIGKRLLSGSFLRVFLLLCNVGVSFLIMPLLIHALGDRMYGFWSIVMTIIGYYGFLDLGLSSAVSRFISQEYGKKDFKAINVTINTSIILFSLVGILSFIVSCCIAFAGCYFLKTDDFLTFRSVIMVLGVGFAIGFPVKTMVGILYSMLRYDLLVYVDLVKLLVRTFLIFYFVNKGMGVVSLAYICLIVDLVGYIFTIFFVKRSFPEMKLGLRYYESTKVKTFFNYSIFSFVSQIADHLRFRIDAFIIAGFTSLSVVTHYSIASRLMEYFIQLISSAIGILTPVYSQYEGRKEYSAIRELLIESTKISTALSVFVGCSIIIYGKFFILKWMGADYIDSYRFLIILCVSFTVALVQNPSVGLLYGISKHKFYAFFNLCEGALNLILSLILVQKYGAYGVALGTAIPMLLVKMFVQPVYVCKIIRIPVFKYYSTVLISAGKCLIPVLIYWFCIKDQLEPDYWTIFMFATLQCLILSPLLFYLILSKQQKTFAFKLYSDSVKLLNIR